MPVQCVWLFRIRELKEFPPPVSQGFKGVSKMVSLAGWRNRGTERSHAFQVPASSRPHPRTIHLRTSLKFVFSHLQAARVPACVSPVEKLGRSSQLPQGFRVHRGARSSSSPTLSQPTAARVSLHQRAECIRAQRQSRPVCLQVREGQSITDKPNSKVLLMKNFSFF